jgi:hypothetical protein
MKKHVLISLLTFFFTTNYYACKCESIDDIKKEFDLTDIIVHAKVISKENVTFLSTLKRNAKKRIINAYKYDKEKFDLINGDYFVKIELEVLHIYKGDKIKKQITIYTSRMSANCGYKNFEVGKEFQVFLSKNCYFDFSFKNADIKTKDYKGNWTNVCTRTGTFNLEDAKTLKLLGLEKKMNKIALLKKNFSFI